MKRYINDILTKILTMTLLLLAGANIAWGQGSDPYEGVWYINNQRLPDDGYYFVPTINCFYNGDEDQPHLTTFKTGKDKNSIWRIVKVAVDSDTYYRIIHNATGKYLMANTAITELKNASAAHRKRVHLETLTTFESDATDKSLFALTEIDPNGKIVAIKSKNVGSTTTGEGTTHIYINPRGNGASEFDSYRAADGRAITHINGTVGFWGNDDSSQPSLASQPGSCWKLEAATSTCANPVIKYIDSDTQIQISYPISSDTDWKIYYTTDGSDPSDITNENRTEIKATATLTDLTGVSKVRAIATKTGWDSSEESVLIASGKTQLIQSKDCEAFYMVPPIVVTGGVVDPIYATTTNIPHAKMGWNFEPAGLYCGIQYYNIINAETGEYLYCNVGSGADNALIMKSSSDIVSDTNNETIDRAKFRLIVQADGSYKVISKWWAAEKPDKYLVTKKSGNDNTAVINLTNGADTKSSWNIVAAPANPKTQFDASFATTTESKYYIIKSANDNTYHIIPPTTIGGLATAKNSTDDNPDWIFSPVTDDDAWTPYYQIINGMTGEYLYYDESVSDASKRFLTSANVNTENEDRYKFIVVKSANSTYTDPYNIIPKALKNQANQATNSINRNSTTLRLGNSRATAASLWLLDQDATFVAPAIITFSAEDMKVYMNSLTVNTSKEIRYNVSYSNADPDDPTSSSSLYDPATGRSVSYGPIYHFKAKTFVGENSSVSTTETIDLTLVDPTIEETSDGVKLLTAQKGVYFCYTTNGDIPSFTDAGNYTGTLVQSNENGIAIIDLSENIYTIKVIAVNTVDGTAYSTATPVSKIVDLRVVTTIDSYADIDSPTAKYKLSSTFIANENDRKQVDGKTIGSSELPFKGSIEGFIDETTGEIKPINLSKPLFDYVEDATIKNVIAEGNISGTVNGSGNVGAIAGNALGKTRIYNCGVLATGSTVITDDDGYTSITLTSSTISGNGYVGGIVGLLDGSSRVINCFSYANITSGSYVGGIVGYNNVAYNATDHKTMVMNCMFYGDITGGGSKAPIYNGAIITNDGDNNGVNNFNFFRLESSYIKDRNIAKVYNCALGAETRFLQRFEFYRHLLNSNRELAAWWATGDATNKNKMMKWVLEPSQIGSSTPYPILKDPGYYPSVVNYTPGTTAYDEANRNEGGKLIGEGDRGVLHVTISMGSSGGAVFSAPSGARFKSGETGKFDLTITDKDYKHFNFNYGKVQLPYYNDYCDGNYTGNRVVTGWKIVNIIGGTAGSYSTGADDVAYTSGELTATPYNFADRKCTNKDKYSVSGRVFNQGAYWDVPEGVTAITIEPYWGKAVYLSDAYWDVTYKNSGTDAMATAANVTNIGGGQRYENGVSTFNGQFVYTSMSNAIASSGSALFAGTTGSSNHTVYDYAVVLVGNYHHTADIEAGNGKPYTVTSVDLDGDNEPDYSLMLRFDSRKGFHPVRYDFLNLIGLGMAQKTTGGTGSYNLGIMQPKYWFEVTNTALFRVTQFEYSPSGRTKKPIILQGGVVEQWVTQQQDAGDLVEYFHVGGNVWFKEFHRGSHQDNTGKSTPHPPVSVTGGDFEEFYLTGLYQSQAAIYDDNAECYINGGRFGEVAGAGMEGIGTSDGKGNITWIIDNADIKEFYGGGINFDNPVHGNIHTIISNSHVDVFCGGPKFGDMVTGRTVTTTAINCTFGTYFGAGYGGNSYNRYAPRNHNNITNFPHNDNQAGSHQSWNTWLAATYTQSYDADYGGVSTQFNYQFLPMSGNVDNVARLFIEFVGFSLATTHNVTSNLTGCTVKGNFYGGGSLGKVDGDVTSTLTNCTVKGNVFGAGYSASTPTVEVMPIGFIEEPYYYTDLGTFKNGVLPSKETSPSTVTYTWEHADVVNSTNAIKTTDTEHILYTEVDLSKSNLGSVSGNVSLTITGNSVIGTSGNNTTGNVYGGGDASYVTPSLVNDQPVANTGNTTVTLAGNTEVLGDVFGGGNNGEVGGSATVNIVETLPTTNNNSGN